AVIGIGYAVLVGSGHDKEAKQYADNSVIAITSHWDVNEFRSRASQELLKGTKQDDLVSLFTRFASLGPLVNYQGAKQHRWNVSVWTGKGKVISADFLAHAKYTNGQAEIELNIVNASGVWKINGFHVDPVALIENKGSRSM